MRSRALHAPRPPRSRDPAHAAHARAPADAQAEELKQARKEREDLGVELYQVQQALAKQQLHLEKTHEKHSAISRVREKAERELAQARAEHGASLQDVKAFRSKYDKHKVRPRRNARRRRRARARRLRSRSRPSRLHVRARSRLRAHARARARAAPRPATVAARARSSSWTG